MIGALWNTRGLNKPGRLQCIADFIRSNRLDFVGFQETKMVVISDSFLQAVCKDMNWKSVPAQGTAGGILVGVKHSFVDIVRCDQHQFCLSLVVVVYGSPYDEFKQDFIKELHMVMGEWQGPTMVGGAFNLVRYQSEKSNGIINFNHATMFNDWINCWG
jgi:hypothetical protein